MKGVVSMKTNKQEGKNLKKTVMAATLIIGASTMMFQGLTQVAVAAVYNKTDTIPTSYVACEKGAFQVTVPEGYTKANYKVGAIDLEYYKNNHPTEKDLTKEEAAELAAQYIWQVYGVDLEGQTIEMGYDTNTDVNPHPKWEANVFMKGQDYHEGYSVKLYGVEIDSVTGELFNISMNRALDAKVNAGPDSSIDESESGEFAVMVKELAKKYDVVHSDIESINCTGQGASFPTNEMGIYGDPTINYEIHGTNGEVAFISLSRYDKMLLGITFNGQAKYDLLWIKELDKKFQMDSESQQNVSTSADETQAPVLVTNGDN
ncbi:hypothetical protein DSECCO2_270940 [anaerobic digester metagenome]